MRALAAVAILATMVVGCADRTEPMGPIDVEDLTPPMPPPPPPRPRPPGIWPEKGAKLRNLEPKVPQNFGRKRIFIDAGHGEPGNVGNKGAYCHLEKDFTLALAFDLASRLAKLGPFDVRVSRQAGDEPRYPARVKAAESWAAHAYLSLHSDNRGKGTPWTPAAGQSCMHDETSPGFSVLWSDTATPPLKAQRLRLARSTSLAMARAGFLPCSCEEYVVSYAADAIPGVFVDRHRKKKRIFVLEHNEVPSILIETHNAWDREEVARWKQSETFDAFARAVAVGLFEALSPKT